MSDTLDRRLDQILPRITSDEFLKGSGLGNELSFHIFDYPPQEELRVRKHVDWLLEQIPKHRSELKVKHANLFNLILGYLRDRKLLDRTFQMQREKGDQYLMNALKGPLHEEKIAKVFAEFAQPHNNDLVLVTGVGNVYPMLRSHTLLNNLHPIMGQTPLVMFYPGRYDGTTLMLFGKSRLAVSANSTRDGRQAPYYRAFRLIPEEPMHAD